MAYYTGRGDSSLSLLFGQEYRIQGQIYLTPVIKSVPVSPPGFPGVRVEEINLDIPLSFVLTKEDALYVCSTIKAFDRFYEEFAES